MRRIIPVIFAAVAFSVGCNSDVTGPNGSVAGTYNLMTINGSPLPYPVSSNRSITSEQLTLNSNGTYADVSHFTDGSSFTELGYYSQNNNALTFNDQTDGITYQGSVSGNVLTEISNGYTAAYQKQ